MTETKNLKLKTYETATDGQELVANYIDDTSDNFQKIDEFCTTDKTLSVEGGIADAKTTGDNISQLKEDIGNVQSDVNNVRSDINTVKANKINNPTNADNGKIARAKNGDVEWVDVGQPTDEQTASAVTKWLDNHPEATTTVQNGAIGEQKISEAFLPLIKNNYVTPEMFGAIGDGEHDDTLAIQSSIDSGKNVFFKSKAQYVISHPIIIDAKIGVIYNGGGCTILHNVSDGFCISNTIKGGCIDCDFEKFNFASIGEKYRGMYVLGGEDYAGSNYLIRCEIRQCTFKGQSEGLYLGGYGIYVHDCYFSNCKIGIVDDCCNYSKFSGNYFIGNQYGMKAMIPYYSVVENSVFYANKNGIEIAGQEQTPINFRLQKNTYRSSKDAKSVRYITIRNSRDIVIDGEYFDNNSVQTISIGEGLTQVETKNILVTNCLNEGNLVIYGNFKNITISGGKHSTIVCGDKKQNGTDTGDIIKIINVSANLITCNITNYDKYKYLIMNDVYIYPTDDGEYGYIGSNVEQIWKNGTIYIQGKKTICPGEI